MAVALIMVMVMAMVINSAAVTVVVVVLVEKFFQTLFPADLNYPGIHPLGLSAGQDMSSVESLLAYYLGAPPPGCW